MIDKGKEVDIYWFSGTGNTLLIAQTLEIFLTTSGFKVNLKAMEKSDASRIDLSRTLGLAFPVAEQGTFPLVWDFIKRLPSPGKLGIRDMEVFMVDTKMIYSGGVKGPMNGISSTRAEPWTRCRLCERNCPTQSWRFDREQNMMLWTKDECIYCLRCFSYCPVQAISYGKKGYTQNKGVSSGVMGKRIL